ncbi:MAG: AAA family ATPase [Bacteroidales bacterium]|nr:AAA family ATPase [Bacteroidales bacterium]
MILKQITIKNFRLYYDKNTFDLSDRLTLIIGDNNDGKTTFFEALEWLFDTSTEDKNIVNISAKRKSELSIGESDTMSVSIVFDHDGEKEIEKQFTFTKQADRSINTSGFKFIGYEERGSERVQVSGKSLLESCFEATIRKYCLFKGESDLKVFDNETALKTLVNKFSNIREIDKYLELAERFEADSQSVVAKEMRNNKKTEQKAKLLEADRLENNKALQRIRNEMQETREEINSYSIRIDKLEQNQDKFEIFQELKKRIENLISKKNEVARRAYCEYNTNLLDRLWILQSFPQILDEFQKKADELSRKKRDLETKDIERKAVEKGKKELADSLMNGATPLPWYVPDENTMREMIDEHICKVCGREAPEGSEAYNFMVKKLNDFLAMQSKKSEKVIEDETPLFSNQYIDEIRTMSNALGGWSKKEIISLRKKIADELDFVQARKRDLDKINQQITESEEEKTRLLLQAQGLSEDMLEKGYRDYKGFNDRKKDAEVKIARLEKDLEFALKEKERIDNEFNNLAPQSGTTAIFNRVHLAFDMIMKAFSKAKDRNITEFLEDLETQTNDYFEKLNIDDFRGRIGIYRSVDGTASIKLYSSDGTLIEKPGGAQMTTMYMSVLFAISNITTLKREQDYPLIFDAPTSSFGEYKEDGFYNIVDNIDKQCIIVTKDLLIVDKAANTKKIDESVLKNMTCKVYQICKHPGFDDKDYTTLFTTLKKIQ